MNSFLSIADRLLRWSAVVLLLTLLASVLIGVISRQLNAPVAWSDELAQYLLVWTAFVGWIIASRRRAHIRITVFADKLPAPLGLALELLTQGLVVLFAVVLLRYSFGLIDRTWDVESIALPITAAALYIVMPLAALALILQALAAMPRWLWPAGASPLRNREPSPYEHADAADPAGLVRRAAARRAALRLDGAGGGRLRLFRRLPPRHRSAEDRAIGHIPSRCSRRRCSS